MKKYWKTSIGIILFCIIYMACILPSAKASTIYDQLTDFSTGDVTIAVEEGYNADALVSISQLARAWHVTSTASADKITTDENALVFKNIGGYLTSITKEGNAIIVEGNVEQAVDYFLMFSSYQNAFDNDGPIYIEEGKFISPLIISPEISAECGNGIIETGEHCDDGNTDTGDGCSSFCTLETEICVDKNGHVYGLEYGYAYDVFDTCYYSDYEQAYYAIDYFCEGVSPNTYASYNYERCSSSCENGICVDRQIQEPECYDSDNEDIYTYGEATATNKFGEKITKADSCFKDTSLTYPLYFVAEAFCYNNEVLVDYAECDGICEHGACVKKDIEEATCTDSDKGTDSSVQGTVSGRTYYGESYAVTDACYNFYDYQYVIEYYCDNNEYTSTHVYCSAGCKKGTCISSISKQSCTDNDETIKNAGIGPYTASSVEERDADGTTYTYYDTCAYSPYDDAMYLEEYTCTESATNELVPLSKYIPCSAGCENGACIPTGTTSMVSCYDSDSGMNYEIKGSITGIDEYENTYEYIDYCKGPYSLIEYYCSGDMQITAEHSCECFEGSCVVPALAGALFLDDIASGIRKPTIVVGTGASKSDGLSAIALSTVYNLPIITDAELSYLEDADYIIIGGPNANSAAKSFTGHLWDYLPGNAVFYTKNFGTHVSLLIAGTTEADTRNAVIQLIADPFMLTESFSVEKVS